MKYFASIITIFSQVLLLAQQKGEIVLTDENIGTPLSKQVLIIEDKDHDISLESLLEIKDTDELYQLTDENKTVKFTTSRFWIKFSVTNQTDITQFYLETARPITDKVIFYQIEGTSIARKLKNGDDFPYHQKEIKHRKNIFPLAIEKGERQTYVLEIISGGEGIILPVKIHDTKAFFEQDYKDQFKNGFYFGLVSLIIVIYFFFFLLLRDVTFLYYILYVFFQGLLQFSLDGYSHHHFFSNNDYLVNRVPPSAGAIAIIFMLIYVNKFLDLKSKQRGFRTAFLIAGILTIISLVFIFLPGKLHAISYPMVNAFSLISIILAVTSIFYLRAKKVKVDIYFTVAFVVLIAGAVIFILGNFNIIQDSRISHNSLKIGSVLEFVILSIAMSYKYKELQQDKEDAQARALKNLEEKNAIMDESNIRLERQVKERTAEIELQKEELSVINEEIVSSIKYAKRIQEAILPSDDAVKKLLPDSFVVYQPKDVVSGDFYFIESTLRKAQNNEKYTIFSAVDCTGHGVPGAFMSIVGNNLLTQSIAEGKINSPAEVLGFLNEGVNKTLKQNQDTKKGAVRDGMDMALCALNDNKTELLFAGAKNPVYIIRERDNDDLGLEEKAKNKTHSLFEIKGDKQPIGNHSDDQLQPFTDHKIKVKKDDMIYVFTDGFADQFGGPKGKKYNYRQFRNLLLEIATLSVDEQKEIITKAFVDWKGNLEQLDDVLVIGVRI